jgi:tetratricopeptide (TPR) repeat protein
MDALAALLLARGAADEADQLRSHSRKLWEVRLRQFPEASYGHALDHCAAFGDLQCSLRLARANYDARPYGEAGERLAQVLTEAGQHQEARQVADAVLRTVWRTPALLATAATIYESTGEATASRQLRNEALRLNLRTLN